MKKHIEIIDGEEVIVKVYAPRATTPRLSARKSSRKHKRSAK